MKSFTIYKIIWLFTSHLKRSLSAIVKHIWQVSALKIFKCDQTIVWRQQSRRLPPEKLHNDSPLSYKFDKDTLISGNIHMIPRCLRFIHDNFKSSSSIAPPRLEPEPREKDNRKDITLEVTGSHYRAWSIGPGLSCFKMYDAGITILWKLERGNKKVRKCIYCSENNKMKFLNKIR